MAPGLENKREPLKKQLCDSRKTVRMYAFRVKARWAVQLFLQDKWFGSGIHEKLPSSLLNSVSRQRHSIQ